MWCIAAVRGSVPLTQADDSEQPLLRHVRTPQFCKVRDLHVVASSSQEDEGPGMVLWTVSSVVTVILTILATLLTALEGPLISAAVGSSYKALAWPKA